MYALALFGMKLHIKVWLGFWDEATDLCFFFLAIIQESKSHFNISFHIKHHLVEYYWFCGLFPENSPISCALICVQYSDFFFLLFSGVPSVWNWSFPVKVLHSGLYPFPELSEFYPTRARVVWGRWKSRNRNQVGGINVAPCIKIGLLCSLSRPFPSLCNSRSITSWLPIILHNQ